MISKETRTRIAEIITKRVIEDDNNHCSIKYTDDDFVIIDGEEFEVVVDGAFNKHEDNSVNWVYIDSIELNGFGDEERTISLDAKEIKYVVDFVEVE